jgi:hypothetical protein
MEGSTSIVNSGWGYLREMIQRVDSHPLAEVTGCSPGLIDFAIKKGF